ncbi:hypothetical protein EAI_02110, partial [Harpegnathos saltator]
KLTGKLMNELTVYYGFAIRQNCDSIIKKEGCKGWAALHHKSSTNKEPHHENYLPGSDS